MSTVLQVPNILVTSPEECVTRLRRLGVADLTRFLYENPFLENRENLSAVIRLSTTPGTPTHVLDALARMPEVMLLVQSWWDEGILEDDTQFTEKFFYLSQRVFLGFGVQSKPYPHLHAMQAQAKRMFAAGRLDPFYMEHLVRNFEPRDRDLHVEYHANDPVALMKLRVSLTLSHTSVGVTDVTRELIADVQQLQQTLAATRWLPVHVSAAEYERVQHLSPTLLAELYPHVLLGGYASYYKHVTGYDMIGSV